MAYISFGIGKQPLYRLFSEDNNIIHSNCQDTLAYDENKFNKMISENRYLDAVEYSRQYVYTDNNVQAKRRAYLNELERYGKERQAQYCNLTQDEKNWCNFANQVKTGIISDSTTNSVSAKYLDAYNTLGTYFDNSTFFKNDDNAKVANKLSVRIPIQKQSLFGIDRLARDNKLSVEDYYSRIGATKEQLDAAGVVISNFEEDGYVSLTFDKSNKYALRIIHGTRAKSSDGRFLQNIDRYAPKIYAVDEAGEEHLCDYNINYYNNDRPTVKSNVSNTIALNTMCKLYDEAESKQNYIWTKNGFNENLYSTVVGTEMFDDIIEENQLWQNGNIKNSDYKDYRTFSKDRVNKLLSSIILQSCKDGVYTNEYDNSEVMHQITDNNQMQELNNMIHIANANNLVTALACYANGQYGTMLVINDPYPSSDDVNKRHEATKEQKTTRLFIPGLWTEEAQRIINNDTGSRAKLEVANMKKYKKNYSIKTLDKDVIFFDGEKWTTEDGLQYLNTRWYGSMEGSELHFLDEDYVSKLIESKFIVDDCIQYMLQNFVNRQGIIIDATDCKRWFGYQALSAVQKMYPQEVFRDDFNEPIDFTTTSPDQYYMNYTRTPMQNTTANDMKDMFDQIYFRLNNWYFNYISNGLYIK